MTLVDQDASSLAKAGVVKSITMPKDMASTESDWTIMTYYIKGILNLSIDAQLMAQIDGDTTHYSKITCKAFWDKVKQAAEQGQEALTINL